MPSHKINKTKGLKRDGFPTLRLEIDSIKHTMITSFAARSEAISKMVNDSVDKLCTPENIAMIIDQYAKDAIENAIKNEIGNFFAHGDGRKVIAESVQKLLCTDKET